jgi:hypothetical protein
MKFRECVLPNKSHQHVTEDGRIIKSIKLSIPVVYENEKTPKICWDSLTPVESIVTLVKTVAEEIISE